MLKITKPEQTYCTFEQIDYGKFFEYHGRTLMKIPPVTPRGSLALYEAIDIVTGKTATVDYLEAVIVHEDAELILK